MKGVINYLISIWYVCLQLDIHVAIEWQDALFNKLYMLTLKRRSMYIIICHHRPFNHLYANSNSWEVFLLFAYSINYDDLTKSNIGWPAGKLAAPKSANNFFQERNLRSSNSNIVNACELNIYPIYILNINIAA